MALSGCSALDELDQVRVPVTDAAAIANGIGGALLTADLNGDGAVQGASEWIALAQALYAIVRNL